VVGLLCDEALQAAHDLACGLALGGAAVYEGAGSLAVPRSDEHDRVEGVVRSTVAASVEPVRLGVAAALWDRACGTQLDHRRLRGQPVGVVDDGSD
jgi:hypothetical protein